MSKPTSLLFAPFVSVSGTQSVWSEIFLCLLLCTYVFPLSVHVLVGNKCPKIEDNHLLTFKMCSTINVEFSYFSPLSAGLFEEEPKV